MDDRVELASARQLPRRHGHRARSGDGAVEALRFQLALDDDHAEFRRRFRHDPLIEQARPRQLAGMRQARVGSVTQALLRAFCGQLIESRQARLRDRGRGIVRAAATVAGRAPRPPTATCLGRWHPRGLRSLGLHARRGSALVRLCRASTPSGCTDWPRPTSLGCSSASKPRTVVGSSRLPRRAAVRHEQGLVGDLGLIKLLAAIREAWVEA